MYLQERGEKQEIFFTREQFFQLKRVYYSKTFTWDYIYYVALYAILVLPCATICSRPSTLMELLLFECVSCQISITALLGTLHSPFFLSKLLIDES